MLGIGRARRLGELLGKESWRWEVGRGGGERRRGVTHTSQTVLPWKMSNYRGHWRAELSLQEVVQVEIGMQAD